MMVALMFTLAGFNLGMAVAHVAFGNTGSAMLSFALSALCALSGFMAL